MNNSLKMLKLKLRMTNTMQALAAKWPQIEQKENSSKVHIMQFHAQKGRGLFWLEGSHPF